MLFFTNPHLNGNDPISGKRHYNDEFNLMHAGLASQTFDYILEDKQIQLLKVAI
jgi:hypothetical protein